jgi:serine/threonine-protein kinase
MRASAVSEFEGKTIRQYELVKFVGRGGHGAVYRARHVVSHEIVAVKVILPEHARDEKLLQRLHQEAEIIRDLRHPHIVHLIETWEDENGVWIVMQWLGGGDLRAYLDRHEVMHPQQIIPILNQVTSALDAAHAAQIIHRDLKPDNIMLDEAGNAYLTDFGIAKRLGHNAITSMGVVVGSPNYLSPEQIMGYDITARTDIYALGILLYELMTGEHPFSTVTSKVQMMMALVQQPIPQVSHLPDPLGSEINALLQRATAKESDKRYPTASSLARHFAQIVEENSSTG